MEFTALFSLSLLLFGLVSQVTAGRSLEIALQLSKHWLPHLRWRAGGLWVPRASCWRPPPAQWPAGLQSRADSQLLLSGLKILNNPRPPLFSLSSVPSSNYLSITDWEHWTYKKLDWVAAVGRFEIIRERPLSDWPCVEWQPGETMWR